MLSYLRLDFSLVCFLGNVFNALHFRFSACIPSVSPSPGGAHAKDDNGNNYWYFLVNISNVDAVLAGAKAVVSEVGPIPYRVYTQCEW